MKGTITMLDVVNTWVLIGFAYCIIGAFIFRWGILKDLELSIMIPITILSGPISWIFVFIAFCKMLIIEWDKHLKLKKEKEIYKKRHLG